LEEWKIFLTVGEIVALFFLVGKPILNLNRTLTRICTQMEQFQQRLDTQRGDIDTMRREAKESHKSLWDHNGKQDVRMDEHEKRISKLEYRNKEE
jgi:hypothetical protein